MLALIKAHKLHIVYFMLMCQTKIMIFKTNNEKTSYMTLKPHIYNEGIKVEICGNWGRFFW